jgi:outer membrane protein W
MFRNAGRAALSIVSVLGIAYTADTAFADDTGGIHPYLMLETSPRSSSALFLHRKTAPDVQLLSPNDRSFQGGAVGFDWGKYWGFELAIDATETDIEAPDLSVGRLAEYGIWTFVPQFRFRYPIPELRLQPYALLGAGLGYGGAHARNPEGTLNYTHAQDTSFVGVAGLGMEYFLAENIALGIEAKYRFLFRTEVEVAGRKQNLNLDSIVYGVALRTYFDSGPGATAPTWLPIRPADSDALRGYLALRAGVNFITNPNANPGIKTESMSFPLFGAGLGFNFGKYWGLEIATDTAKTDITAPVVGRVGEYRYITGLAQLRLRYPVMEDRLSPYVVVGGGMGYGEFNDRRLSAGYYKIGGTGYSPIAAAGTGFDYFITRNISVGLEAKRIFFYRPDMMLNDQTIKLKLDPMLLSAGMRLYFP